MFGTRSTAGLPGTACAARYGTTSGVPNWAANACWRAGSRCWPGNTSTQCSWKAVKSASMVSSESSSPNPTPVTSAPTAGESGRTSTIARRSGCGQAVVAVGVLGQQLGQQSVRKVVAFLHALNRVRELAVGVRVIGRVHQAVVPQLL